MPITHKLHEEIRLRLAIAGHAGELGEVIDGDLREIMALVGDDLTGNANEFVPWSNPQFEYECSCGQRIYSDTEHVH